MKVVQKWLYIYIYTCIYQLAWFSVQNKCKVQGNINDRTFIDVFDLLLPENFQQTRTVKVICELGEFTLVTR